MCQNISKYIRPKTHVYLKWHLSRKRSKVNQYLLRLSKFCYVLATFTMYDTIKYTYAKWSKLSNCVRTYQNVSGPKHRFPTFFYMFLIGLFLFAFALLYRTKPGRNMDEQEEQEEGDEGGEEDQIRARRRRRRTRRTRRRGRG